MEQREIKFRAWDCIVEKMIYPRTNGRDLIWDVGSHTSVYVVNKLLKQEEDYYIWLQYTGLKDENGKEIYEGDIIKDEVKRIATVCWNYDRASFYLKYKDMDIGFPSGQKPERFGIIGNIYENPELVKSNK